MKLQRFAINQSTAIMILAIITLITLSVVITMLNNYFQTADFQRQQLLNLTNAIHQSDLKVSNKTDSLITAHIEQDHDIHSRQESIINNQLKIINNTNAINDSLNIIKHASDQVDSIVARQKNNTEKLEKMYEAINQSRLISK